MKKKTIENLRDDYQRVTGKEAAIRWNRSTLEKKITDAEILQASYAVKDAAQPVRSITDPNPAFEALASEPDSDTVGNEKDQVEIDRRGGAREGAGRPDGQSDERARIERLLELDVPDLAVWKILQGLNLILVKFTPAGFDADQLDSLALGVTLPLYYWFPAVQGAGNKWTLHLQAIEYIGKPIKERAEFINQLTKQKELEHDKEKEQSPKAAGPASGVEAAGKPTGKPAVQVHFNVKPKGKHAPSRTKKFKR